MSGSEKSAPFWRWLPWVLLAAVSITSAVYIGILRADLDYYERQRAAALEPDPLLTSSQQEAMRAKLAAGSGQPIWFVTDTSNPTAKATQKALRRIFEQSGWVVRGEQPAAFPLKPGIFFLMADETPPDYVQLALEALEETHLVTSAGRAYRDFYAEKKTADPSWRGFELAPEQPYVVVVGRTPPAETAAESN